jgi:hypothetical protein
MVTFDQFCKSLLVASLGAAYEEVVGNRQALPAMVLHLAKLLRIHEHKPLCPTLHPGMSQP